MKHIQSAGIVIYCGAKNNIEYLVLHYSAGHWEFPKGKVEPGETIAQAAKRELQEETGITKVTLHPNFSTSIEYDFTDYDGKPAHKTVTFLLGSVTSKDVTLSDEHQDFVWLPYEQALQKVTFQNARTVLQQVYEYLLK